MDLNDETVLDIIERWDATGLLYGLPAWEKEELSLLYDDAARLILSKKVTEKIPQDTYETFNGVMFPTIRRLYRRVGINFDIENMLTELLLRVEGNKKELVKEPTPENNPIVDFCINFADNYEDEKTSEKRFSKEDYTERVDKILNHMRDILLNDKMVSFVDRSEDEWKTILSNKEKSEIQTRLWNQKIATELFRMTLMDTNRGV